MPLEASTMRAIVALLTLLSLVLTNPSPVSAADGGALQGWAFEVRTGDRYGWLGSWTLEACETLRQGAIAEQMGESIGLCFRVTLVDEPTTGVEVWVLADDTSFALAPSPELCDEESLRPVIRPVALTTACPRMWFRVAV
jgi:hypothetical protein